MASTKKETVTAKRRPPAAGKGRPKGAVNKTTRALKEAILLAAEQAGGSEGLVGYLTEQARVTPTAFMTLLGKVLPLQVTGEGDGPLKVEIIKRTYADDSASSE